MSCTQEFPRTQQAKRNIENSTFISDWLFDNVKLGRCIAYVGQLIEVRKDIDRKHWKYLFKFGYAEEYNLTEDEVIAILKSKTPQNFPNSVKYCDWCKGTSCLLHFHHYPMKKSKGGQQTINVCASCHCEFHFLLDNKQYRLTKEIQDQIEWCRQYKIDLFKTFEGI